jgi:hypothetical protein
MILFFFFNFLKQRQEIQKVIMILLHYIKYKLYFFIGLSYIILLKIILHTFL